MLNILLLGLLRSTGRSGVSDAAVVLVQWFLDEVHISLFEPEKERADELELRGSVGF